MVLELILAFTFLASIAGLSGGLILLIREKFAKKISVYLVSFAAGTLLATALLDLVPEGLEILKNNELAMIILIAGIILFFVIEKLLIWTHCHGRECEVHHESKPYMLMIGDTIHNFIDGIIVAASFLVSVPLGIVTAIAIFFHEIPQEMGDFGTMIHLGIKRKKIILFNLLSACASFAGAILTYFFAQTAQNILGPVVMLAAGHILYISIGDLIPELHKETRISRAMVQIVIMLLGVVLIFWMIKTFVE